MKRVAVLAVALVLTIVHPTVASSRDGFAGTMSLGNCDAPVRFVPRSDGRDVRFSITSEEGGAELVLTDESVAVQLGDRLLHKVRHELKRKQEEDEDNPLGQVIKGAVIGTVRTLLEYCVACPIRELRDVEYRQGRLVFTTKDGDRIFANMDICDRDVASSFSESDARAFVRAFHRARGDAY